MTAGPPGQPYYPYLPPYGVAEAPGATPAMVLGIISLCVLPIGCCCGIGGLASFGLGIAAVIFGFIARSRISASQGALRGDGKALAGIVTGGIAAAVAVVLFLLVLAVGLGSGSLLNYFNSFATPSPSG